MYIKIKVLDSDLEHKRLSKKIVIKFTAFESESRVDPCHNLKGNGFCHEKLT